jgi:predicted secreted protein
MDKLGFCLLASAVLLTVAGCGPVITGQTATSTFTDSSQVIHVASGERFAIELPSNPSVPYQWVLDIQGTVDLAAETFIPATPVLTGSGSIGIYSFETTEPGSATITFSYTGLNGAVSEQKVFQLEIAAA